MAKRNVSGWKSTCEVLHLGVLLIIFLLYKNTLGEALCVLISERMGKRFGKVM